MRQTISFTLIAGCVVFAFATRHPVANAQSRKKPAASGPTVTGLPWVVVKGSLSDFTGKSDTIVADFETEAEAKEEARRRNEEEQDWTRWHYLYHKRSADDDSPKAIEEPSLEKPAEAPATKGKPTTITMPKLNWVDVDIKPSKPDKSNPDSVAGKRARYRIGQWEYIAEFLDDGTVVFRSVSDGQVVSTGTWSQTGRAVSIDTKTYRYLALRDGDKLDGKRVKKGGKAAELWTATLGAKADERKAVGAAKPAADLKYYVVTRGTETYLNNSTEFPTLEWALRDARDGWKVWKNRNDMLGVSVVDSSGKVHLKLGK